MSEALNNAKISKITGNTTFHQSLTSLTNSSGKIQKSSEEVRSRKMNISPLTVSSIDVRNDNEVR